MQHQGSPTAVRLLLMNEYAEFSSLTRGLLTTIVHLPPCREPVQSEFDYPAWPLSVRGISYIHRWRSRTGPHSRSRARGGLVRCTARTQLQLPPLPGFCPSSVAVVVSVPFSHSNSRVSRDSHTTTLHSYSPRETRLHARACPPSSP